MQDAISMGWGLWKVLEKSLDIPATEQHLFRGFPTSSYIASLLLVLKAIWHTSLPLPNAGFGQCQQRHLSPDYLLRAHFFG